MRAQFLVNVPGSSGRRVVPIRVIPSASNRRGWDEGWSTSVARTRTKMSVIHAADYAPTYSGNFIASLRAAAQECRAHGYRTVWVFPDIVRDFEWFQALSTESDASAYTL